MSAKIFSIYLNEELNQKVNNNNKNNNSSNTLVFGRWPQTKIAVAGPIFININRIQALLSSIFKGSGQLSGVGLVNQVGNNCAANDAG